MAEAAAVSPPDVRRAARRGLVVFLVLVVVLSSTIEATWIMNPTMGILVIPLMWSPAVASVIARLVLREGFSDVSFRFGGRRTLPWIALGLILPIVVGTLAYGTAWLTGLVGFEGSVGGFVMGVVAAATYLTVIGCLFTAGRR
jgi:membrane associated rhomboid family serine protease